MWDNNFLKIVQWCNGSTIDSGSVCLGSNPNWTTEGFHDFLVFQYDSNGALVKKVDLVNSETKVNLSEMPKGNYVCKLMEGDKLLETKKLITVE